ncbi:MAG TPA: hypothetical protein VFS15_26525 [Kofleriaceae bacterium]|nr:hypothetical protein [Kofleriaceae bacterium]
MRAVPALLVLALTGCADEPVPIPPTCNGSVELCARRFDEVAYPTTHNAMSNAEDGWESPNQNRNIGHQLEDGVRALMLDVHEWGDGILLCHGFCPLGSLPLVDGLSIIRDFLHDHRGEVVTIIFESYTTAAAIADAFEKSGLDHYVHAHTAGTPWPTLRELIDADERVIVLTDNEGGAYDWYMDVWQQAFETPFAAETVDDFTCDPGRGDPTNQLFIFNHFLTAPLAVPDQAPTVNADPFLVDRARDCMAARGHLANFVTVDFYDEGDLFDAVRALDGL